MSSILATEVFDDEKKNDCFGNCPYRISMRVFQ